MKLFLFFVSFLFSLSLNAKELALTFDDAPMGDSPHFTSEQRTDELIRKLKALKVPPVMVFANPCKREDSKSVIKQLKKYREAGHYIGNHTCSHPRLDEVGFDTYYKDAAKADELLSPLFQGQKFFRFPYLNEGKDKKLRDQMRTWLKESKYKNSLVSIDNDDYFFSFKINQAKEKNLKIDYKKVEALLIKHVLDAANFYNELAIKSMGYSPKHTLLLHEMDTTVMFIEPLVKAIRNDGWKIIGIQEAFKDKLYMSKPKNTYSGNGIIAQKHFEASDEKIGFNEVDDIRTELDLILGL